MGGHAELIAKIVRYMNATGCFVWPNRTGAYRRHGSWIEYGYPGAGDVLGMSRSGRFITVEVKDGKDTQKEDQFDFMLLTRLHKGVYIICRSFEEFMEKYEKEDL